MPGSLEELIAALDDPSGGAEDAKYDLIAQGAGIVPELAARIGSLGRFGKLTAIEVFEALKDPRACPALVRLLSDDAETVVEWSASALGGLGCRDAVEQLRDVWSRSVVAQVPPDWTGPSAFRRALTDLGARQPVVPQLTAQLLQRHPDSDMDLVASTHLAAVVTDLADHDQVVLGFQIWRVADDGHLYWTQSDHEDWDFDWSARWVDNVTLARRAALSAATTVGPNLLISLDWVDPRDLKLSREPGRSR